MRAAVLSLFIITAFCQAAAPPIRPRFPLSRVTTFVTGPLTHEGYVDYAAALIAIRTKGLKPEDNAAVILWRVMGPKPEGSLVSEPHFTAIGMKRPPEAGPYLLGLTQYIKENLGGIQGQELDGFFAEHGKAMSRPWTAKESPRMAGWIKANERPLALALEAVKKERYYNALMPPGSGDLIGALLPSAQRCREVASLLTARAMLAAGEGRADDAWRDLLACHRLGRLVGQGNLLIEGLVGYAIEAIACRATVAFIETARPDGKRLARMMADLGRLPPLPAMADKVELAERLVHLDCVQMLERGGAKYLESLMGEKGIDRMLHGGVDYTPMMRMGNEWFDRLAAAMRAPTHRERLRLAAGIDEDLKKLKAQRPAVVNAALWVLGGPTWRGKQIGNILVCMLVPAVGKVRAAEDRTQQTHDNLMVALALEAYRRENGTYPEKLAALAPKFIPAVPGDVFSGEGLIYRREGKGYLLYSIGPDGKNDGGRGRDDDPPGDDIVVRMPPPKE